MSKAATTSFDITRIGQIAVPVSDIERAVAFYRDVLGMHFLFLAPPGLGFFELGGIRLMLDAPAKATGEGGGSIIYYHVPDLRATHALLTLRGVYFETRPHLIAKMPDHELWMAFFRDPDDNLLALMSEVRT